MAFSRSGVSKSGQMAPATKLKTVASAPQGSPAHQVGLIAQDRGERGEGAIRENRPFFRRIAAGPWRMQAAADLAADNP